MKEEAERAEKARRDAMRGRLPINGTGPPVSAPPPPVLYTRASSANSINSSVDSDATSTPSKVSGPKMGTSEIDPSATAAAVAAAAAGSAPYPVATAPGGGTNTTSESTPKNGGTAPDQSAASIATGATGAVGPGVASGPGRFFVGRKFPGRGARGRMGTLAAAGRGNNAGSPGPRKGKPPANAGAMRGGAAVAGKPGAAAVATGASVPGAPVATPSVGILKTSASAATAAGSSSTSSQGLTGSLDGGILSLGLVGAADVGAVGGIGGTGVGSGNAGDPMVVEGAAEGSASPPPPSSPPIGDDPAGASGPPPIVSMEDLTRADALAKKKQRKAKRLEPAAKKVSWADRAGRVLHAIKEFHSEDSPRTVSDPTSSPDADGQSADNLSLHHAGHSHWAERVKREREMERKFHGKGKGKSKGGGEGGGRGSSSAAAKAEAEAEAAAAIAAAARKAMKPTVAWRRPGPYEDGVVHEDVIALEVESSEAESQGARTRAGLEQARTFFQYTTVLVSLRQALLKRD